MNETSTRDYFAGCAMIALAARVPGGFPTEAECYRVADKMIAWTRDEGGTTERRVIGPVGARVRRTRECVLRDMPEKLGTDYAAEVGVVSSMGQSVMVQWPSLSAPIPYTLDELERVP